MRNTPKWFKCYSPERHRIFHIANFSSKTEECHFLSFDSVANFIGDRALRNLKGKVKPIDNSHLWKEPLRVD